MKLFSRFWASTAILETARCGRCAHVLPDETLSFCSYCGVPFSRVPPTMAYTTLASSQEKRALHRHQLRLLLAGLGLFSGFWLLLAAASTLSQKMALAELKPLRHVNIYLWDHPDYPSLANAQRLQGVSAGLQAFADHFGQPLKNISLHQDQLPPEMGPDYFQSHPNFTSLNFWEKEAFPRFARKWASDPQRPLSLLITNIPITNDLGSDSPMPTRHLPHTGLIGGLGHPAFALVSTHRILAETPKLFPKKATRAHLQVRYLGEYLLAHELGHALLGLPDYLMVEETSPRAPAALADLSLLGQCLMHTDSGGGYQAWEHLRQRPLGQRTGVGAQGCPEYATVLEAFELRAEALKALQAGEQKQARHLHEQAILKVRSKTLPWVAQEWEREHVIFLSLTERWWAALFMIESGK